MTSVIARAILMSELGDDLLYNVDLSYPTCCVTPPKLSVTVVVASPLLLQSPSDE